MRLYVNGVQESTTAQSGTVNPVSQNLFAGKTITNGVSQGYLSGALDELRVYSRALSAAEVQDLYASNTPTVFSTFTYDGDGNRVKKVESGQTTVYPNKYYEKNVTTGEVTTSYYHGGTLVALRKGTALEYVHQDHLDGTSVSTDSTGATKSSLKYLPYGETLTGTGALGTDREFTGQRLDGTGLYFYNARYYDPTIGRFVSADTIVASFSNPQALNRYSYVGNNPLTYNDPTGNCFGPFKKACHKAKDLIVDKAKNAKDLAVGALKGTVQAAATYTGAVAQVLDPVYDFLEPVNVIAKPAEVVINNTVVPAANATGAGINKVEINAVRGFVDVKVSEDGFVAKVVDKVTGGQAAATVPINPIPSFPSLPLPFQPASVVVQRTEALGNFLPVNTRHEEDHVIQQQAFGAFGFLVSYFLGQAIFGYADNPFEAQARSFSGESSSPSGSSNGDSSSPVNGGDSYFDLIYAHM